MGTFANSEDPDEMQHKTAFHQGTCMHYFLRLKQPLGPEKHQNLENSTCDSLKYTIARQYHTYCINVYGKIPSEYNGLIFVCLIGKEKVYP